MWFCHSKRARIPGTEDMDEEHRDYRFHIRQSCKGMLQQFRQRLTGAVPVAGGKGAFCL